MVGDLVFSDENGMSFVDFIGKFIALPLVQLRVVGTCDVIANTALGLLSLKGLPLEQIVDLVGMNNFPDVGIPYFNLPSNHPDGGILLDLQASLQNPSVASVYLGDVTLELFTFEEEAKIGTVSGTEIRLVPGENILALTGNVLPDPADLEAISLFFSDYVNGIDGMVISKGLNAGESPIVWLQEVVKKLILTAVFPGYGDAVVKKLNLASLGINFPGGTAPPPTSSEVIANFEIPFGFPFTVSTLSLSPFQVRETMKFVGNRFGRSRWSCRSSTKTGSPS